MIEKLIILLAQSPMIKLVMLCVIADTILGCLRAIKYRKFNSSVGIDGAIRKVAMLACVVVLMVADVLININLITMIPGDYTSILGIEKIGLCEFFSLLFIAYECISVLKNMLLCGLPVPKKLKGWLEEFLENMTAELPEEVTVKEAEKNKLIGASDWRPFLWRQRRMKYKNIYDYIVKNMDNMHGDFSVSVTDISEIEPDMIMVSIHPTDCDGDTADFYLHADGMEEYTTLV